MELRIALSSAEADRSSASELVSPSFADCVEKKKKKGRREATLVLRMVTTEASRAAGVRDGERGAVRF